MAQRVIQPRPLAEGVQRWATTVRLPKPTVAALSSLAAGTSGARGLACASDGARDELSFGHLLTHCPAALLSRPNREVVTFAAGALAGALGKTATAPFDRLKLLLQCKGGLQGGALQEAAASGSLVRSFVAIGRTEGLTGYWRGNAAQVVRVLPYSAAQLYSYDRFKSILGRREAAVARARGEEPPLPSIRLRLTAGAMAGMFSTILTYPLDTLRLRFAVDPSARTLRGACAAIARDGGGAAFYRGLPTALAGIAPYMALELGAFDTLPQEMPSFARGFLAALLATGFCYPLDTVRRQLQMAGTGATTMGIVRSSLRAEGVRGLYRGFIPNAVKNLPNKGIRLGVYDGVKRTVAASQMAYDADVDRVKKLGRKGKKAQRRLTTLN